MSQGTSGGGGGVGVCGLLGVAFVVLKLTSVIDWSWWWVLFPFWIPLVVVAAILLAVGIAVGVILLARCFLERKKRGKR